APAIAAAAPVAAVAVVEPARDRDRAAPARAQSREQRDAEGARELQDAGRHALHDSPAVARRAGARTERGPAPRHVPVLILPPAGPSGTTARRRRDRARTAPTRRDR